ncbi:MAG: ATP-binding protein [bacterium]
MNQLFTILEFFTFIAGTLIGAYVLSRGYRNRLNQALALAAFGMAGWNISIFLLLTELVPPDVPANLAFSFGAVIIASFAWFVFLFPRKIAHYWWFTIPSWILGAVFIILPFIPSFLANPRIEDGHIVADFDPNLIGMWTLYYTGYFIVILVLLLVRTLKASGVDRRRLWHIMFGFLLYFVPSVFTNLLLPIVFNDWRWNNLGPIVIIFPVLFLLGAVRRYRLLDIKWIVGKSLFFSILIGLVLWLVSTTALLLSTLVSQEFSMMIAAVLIVVLYGPITKCLETIISKVAHRGTYDPEKAQQEIFEIIRTVVELPVMVDLLSERFNNYFSVHEIATIILRPKSDQVIHAKLEGFSRAILNETPALLKMVKKHKFKLVELEEIKWLREFDQGMAKRGHYKQDAALLERLKIATMVPLIIDGRIVGIVVFGTRRFDRALHNRDIKFLNIIRGAISPAVENAAKYAEIKHLYAELSSLDKVKSEFIGVVSHRFRTPLSAIRWNLETVLDTYGKQLDAEAYDAINNTHDRALFLINTLDRLFDSLEIERGTFKLKKTNFSAKKVLAPLAKETRANCQILGLEYTSKISPVEIYGDVERIAAICQSMLQNAQQYTTKGSIRFEVSQEKNGKIKIIVSDTGIGIPKEEIEKVFDKFYRAKNAVLTYTDGQGLGLYLTKVIVDAHRGKIDVNSEVGKGTTFTVTLPGAPKLKKRSAKKLIR